MNIVAWLPIFFVALIAVPAAISARTPKFQSFRQRMRPTSPEKRP